MVIIGQVWTAWCYEASMCRTSLEAKQNWRLGISIGYGKKMASFSASKLVINLNHRLQSVSAMFWEL